MFFKFIFPWCGVLTHKQSPNVLEIDRNRKLITHNIQLGYVSWINNHLTIIPLKNIVYSLVLLVREHLNCNCGKYLTRNQPTNNLQSSVAVCRIFEKNCPIWNLLSYSWIMDFGQTYVTPIE